MLLQANLWLRLYYFTGQNISPGRATQLTQTAYSKYGCSYFTSICDLNYFIVEVTRCHVIALVFVVESHGVVLIHRGFFLVHHRLVAHFGFR